MPLGLSRIVSPWWQLRLVAAKTTGLQLSRTRYNDAVQATNNEELLLNLVRLRYAEGPSWLRLTGVNVQYEMTAGGDLRAGLERGEVDRWGGGNLGFADRPTLTFDPRRTSEFTRALITRLDVETLLTLDAAGWDSDRTLRIFVEQMNGIGNAIEAGGPTPARAPEYAEFKYLTSLLGELNQQRGIAFSTATQDKDVIGAVPMAQVDAKDLLAMQTAGYGVRRLEGEQGFQLTRSKTGHVLKVDPRVAGSHDWQEAARLLRLDSDSDQYGVEVIPTDQPPPRDEGHRNDKLTLTTRSVFEALYYLCQDIDVPVEHCQQGLATVTCQADGTPFDWGDVSGDLFRVHVSKRRRNART